MITFETPLKRLKYLVLKEVAELAKDNKLTKRELETIPYNIIKNDKSEYRCCVYKERAVVYERAVLAAGFVPTDNTIKDLQKIEDKTHAMFVISSACDQCPIDRYNVTGACRGCIQHKCMEVCPAKAITRVNGRSYINQNLCRECGMCRKACPYNAIAEVMRPCKRSCPTGALEINTDDRKAKIEKEKCISCGACMAACPFGAISDLSYIADVTRELMLDKEMYAVVAPSITGQFGPKVTVGQIKNAFKKLGFKDMVEAACGADAVSVNEGNEFAERINRGDKFMTNSCCSGFMNYIELKFPNLLENMSNTVSPMIATARLIKKFHKDAIVIFIGPCTAKKVEVTRETIKDDIDYVLTFEEIAALLGAFSIEPEKCKDEVINDASIFGRGFAQGGGVTAAIENYISDKKIDAKFKPIKASGKDEIRKTMMSAKVGRLPGNFIEGMMCEGGCIGGAATMVSLMKARSQLIKFTKQSDKKSILSNDNLKKFEDIDMER